MREARMGDTGAGELLERKLKQTVKLDSSVLYRLQLFVLY